MALSITSIERTSSMIETSEAVREHYQAAISSRRELLKSIAQMFDTMGDGHITTGRLAGLDQFHFGGLAATAEFAQRTGVLNGRATWMRPRA